MRKARKKILTPADLRSFDKDLVDLDGKVVLVTGGTGSFGQHFIGQVINKFRPRKLIVFSRDEQKQYRMAQDFPTEKHRFMRYFIGDVRDRDRLDLAMRDVDIIIHAAALKHVPIAEYNPFECIHTNVLGAENVLHTAIRRGVTKVVALSTDKATNPVNLYGASKLAADKIFFAANNLSGDDGCRFAVVRYGNVLNSRGSVLELFEKILKKRGAPITITDERMTRFWITLGQAANFVLSSCEIMQGGEIFVPKIPSMSMTDVAKTLAPKRKQKIIGIRPGEKLHEMMISEDEARSTFELDDRYVILPAFHWWGPDYDRPLLNKPVSEGFRYASDSNREWLGPEAFKKLMKNAEV